MKKEHDIVYIQTDTPVYDDLLEIRKRKANGQIELYSHKEVWNE